MCDVLIEIPGNDLGSLGDPNSWRWNLQYVQVGGEGGREGGHRQQHATGRP